MDADSVLAELIGRPFAYVPDPPDTFDCSALVEYARRHMYQIATPLIGACDSLDTVAIREVFDTLRDGPLWERVKSPQDGDIVTATSNVTRIYAHVGMWCHGAILHAFADGAGGGSVQLTDARVWQRLYRDTEIWRLRA